MESVVVMTGKTGGETAYLWMIIHPLASGGTAVAQPGGSMRDQDSVAACDEHGLAMVLTGVRHFRH